MNPDGLHHKEAHLLQGIKISFLVTVILDQRLDQNVLRNRLSLSETMVCGSPKCTQTCSKNILEVASAVMLFLQATKIAILEKWSTTTKTQSFPHLVDGRPDM
jgi:hypothetical protein